MVFLIKLYVFIVSCKIPIFDLTLFSQKRSIYSNIRYNGQWRRDGRNYRDTILRFEAEFQRAIVQMSPIVDLINLILLLYKMHVIFLRIGFQSYLPFSEQFQKSFIPHVIFGLYCVQITLSEA